MKVIISGIVAAVVLAALGAYVLTGEQKPAWEVYSTSSARVGNPGHNLVGPNWSGEPEVQRKNS